MAIRTIIPVASLQPDIGCPVFAARERREIEQHSPYTDFLCPNHASSPVCLGFQRRWRCEIQRIVPHCLLYESCKQRGKAGSLLAFALAWQASKLSNERVFVPGTFTRSPHAPGGRTPITAGDARRRAFFVRFIAAGPRRAVNFSLQSR